MANASETTIEAALKRLAEQYPCLGRTARCSAPGTMAPPWQAVDASGLRLWSGEWRDDATEESPSVVCTKDEPVHAEATAEAGEEKPKVLPLWPLLLEGRRFEAWPAEAMLCTAPPPQPPVPEPADKEEFERLKEADPKFERSYWCSYNEEDRIRAYEHARACEAARAKVIELAREDAGSDAMGEHLHLMLTYSLGNTKEFEIGCAYSQQYNRMDEFAVYLRVMPDFLDRHYEAGSCWARDRLIEEAKALVDQLLPAEAAEMRRMKDEEDLYA